MLDVRSGGSSKDTAITAMRSNGIEMRTDNGIRKPAWSVREIRIEANPAARASKPRPLPSAVVLGVSHVPAELSKDSGWAFSVWVATDFSRAFD
jgi:hypothetical protein